jgi:hypothetical protein
MLVPLRLCLLLVPVLTGVLIFEILVRVSGTDVNPNPNWRFHPVLGWSQTPGAQYDYFVDGEEVHVEFNSMGFRDVERAVENPKNRRRIVVVGDSFCEAVQVNLAETFHQYLQQMLNRNKKESWEVINLGVGDFGNAQELIALSEYGLPYSPEIVIFQIFPLNDICNNAIELQGLCKSPNDSYRPYLIEEDGALSVTSAQPVRNFLRRHFASYGVLEKAVLSFVLRPPDPEDEDFRRRRMRELGYPPIDPLLGTYVIESKQIAAVAAGWRIFEAVLEQMDQLTREQGSHLIPLVIPFEARVGTVWNDLAKSVPDLEMVQDYPEQRIERACLKLGLEPIFMKEVFEENLDIYLPPRGGHLNPEAHRLVAEQIFRYLSNRGLIG